MTTLLVAGTVALLAVWSAVALMPPASWRRPWVEGAFLVGVALGSFGLVASLNRPGGNITGVHVFLIGLEGKRLGLMREFVPQAALMGLLVNPRSPAANCSSRCPRPSFPFT